MSSDLQIAANRRNAQLSTGPSSPEGKQAVRFNSLRHGLDARVFKLCDESEELLAALRDGLYAEWQPQTPTENLLVDRLATAQWRLMRLDRVEAGYYEYRWRVSGPTRKLPSVAAEDGCIYHYGVEDKTFLSLALHYSRAERTFNRTLRQLLDLAAHRSPRAGHPIPPKLALLSQNTFFDPAPDPSPDPATTLPHSDDSQIPNDPTPDPICNP